MWSFWRLKIDVYLANGCLNCLTKKECGKRCYEINTFRMALCPRRSPNQLILSFGKDLCGLKMIFFSRGAFVLGDGSGIRFWEDTWLVNTPLSYQYPSLFRIVQHKNVSVATVFATIPLNIRFRRNLIGANWTRWLHLVQRLMMVNLSNEPDSFVWSLTPSDVFSVKCLYADYMDGQTVFHQKFIWKLKIPSKVKIFMWFLDRQVLLTKDNLAKRNWEESLKCCFCESDETVQHLFVS